MARPTTYDAELKAELLSAAADLMARKGPQGTSLREIAERAETSTTAIYAIYGGKSALLKAVVDSGFASFAQSQHDAKSQGLRALGHAYREWALANSSLYALMFAGLSSPIPDCGPSPDAAAAAIEPLLAATRELLADRQEAHTAESLATAIWGQVHGLVSLELASQAVLATSWEASFDAALDMIAKSFVPADFIADPSGKTS